VEKRGLDERPGHHEAIIDEATYNAAITGARKRFSPGERPRPHRLYLLKGVIACEHGHPMHGDCKVSRGQEWRYYRCRLCDAPSVSADAAERVVIDAISKMTLPPSVIDQARAELARRLDVPQADLAGTKRKRLEGRLNRLTQLYGWGELGADDYRRQMTETRAMLAELPDWRRTSSRRPGLSSRSSCSSSWSASRLRIGRLTRTPSSGRHRPGRSSGKVRCYGAPGRF
jgi:hypothetical protein